MQLGSGLDRQIFDQQNQLRMDPRSFIPHLKTRMQNFNGNIYVPGGNKPIEDTSEGPAAVQQAIQALEVQPELPALEWNDGLYIAAQDHCLDAGQNNLTSWLGSDGSNPGTRIARYGTAGPSQGQNLAYGSSNTGIDIVLQLIIDDGAPLRTSRQVIFNPNYRLTGISSCAHQTRTMMASLLYTDFYQVNQIGMQKISELAGNNPMPVVKPVHVPGAQLRPLVRGQDAELDRAVYHWQNKLRTDPDELISALKELAATWTSQTEPEAAANAVEALENLKGSGLAALEWSEGLNLAAKDHCDDLGAQGLIGHFGTDESSPFDRISRYGKPGWWRGENLSFNSFGVPAGAEVDAEAKNIVLKMFIDEGVAGRPNRSRMLNPEFNLVGIFSCPHKRGGLHTSMTVLDYAGTFEANDRTQQGVMQAQESNAEGVPSVIADIPISDDLPEIKRCTDLPTSVVSRDTCTFFDINNEIRTDPKSFKRTLQNRIEEIENDDKVQMIAVSQLPSKMESEEKTYEELIKTERAISALDRQMPLPALKWSNALFLSAKEHCEQQQDHEQPSIYTDLYDSDKNIEAKQRPDTAAKEFANVTGVELVTATGKTIMDQVIDNLLDPGNRSILLNPLSYYSAAETCRNSMTKNGLAIQNFATSVEPNDEGKKVIAELKKKEDVIDECDDTPLGYAEEKGTLQRLLIDLMRQEADAMSSRNKSDEEIINFKIRATIEALKQVEEQVEAAKQTVADRKKAKAEWLVCQRRLPLFEERAFQSRESLYLYQRSKEDKTLALSNLIGNAVTRSAFARDIAKVEAQIARASKASDKHEASYQDAKKKCGALELEALCKKDLPAPVVPAEVEEQPTNSVVKQPTNSVVGVYDISGGSFENIAMVDLNETDPTSMDIQDSLDGGLMEEGLFSGNEYSNLMASNNGRRLSASNPNTSTSVSDATALAFGSPDFAI